MKTYCKRRCFRLLNLVLLVGKVMLSIANLMVDGGCIATTGDTRLFCIQIYISGYLHVYLSNKLSVLQTKISILFSLHGLSVRQATRQTLRNDSHNF
jgi:hypothetical protein